MDGRRDAVGPPEDDDGRSPLRRRDFAIYWWSQMVSSPGTWVHNVTASVLILTLTGSPFMVGVVNFALFIPTLLFSLSAGTLGDRVDKRRVVAAAQTGACLVAGATAVLSATGVLTPALLVLTCFLLGTANATSKPAMSAMIPLLVPRPAVARATAVNVLQFQLGQIIGPGLASIILLVGTPAWGFGLNALSCLGPVLGMQLIRLRASTAPARDPRSRSRGTSDGLRFIRGSATMPAILLTVVLSNGAVEALRTLAPTLAAGLDRPAAAGVIIMGYSVGALLGLLVFPRVERRLRGRVVLVSAFGLQALGVTCVALAPGLPLTVLAAAPIGVGFSFTTPLLSASLQALTPDQYLSRVMSTFSIAHLGLRPVFALVAGGLASLLDARAALVAFVVLALAAAVLVHRRRVADG
jgi:MFS family permease